MAAKTKSAPKSARKPVAKKAAKELDPVQVAMDSLTQLRGDLLAAGDFVRADRVKRAFRELTR